MNKYTDFSVPNHPAMEKISYSIRAMKPADIPAAMRLKDIEGWNQTQSDWNIFLKNNSGLCLVADLNGSVIGTAAAINYSNTVSWISMVLVDKEFRGQGISGKLLSGLIESLTSCKSVKLDATPAGMKVYEKIGFTCEYKIFRMTNPAVNFRFPEKVDNLPKKAKSDDIAEISDFDQRVFGADRTILLEALRSEYPDRAWILRKNNRITGYALGRAGTRYNHIGPVGALLVQDAVILIKKILENNTERPVVVDIPENMNELSGWLQSTGFASRRHFTRMYFKKNPFPGEINKQFLICGPEFG